MNHYYLSVHVSYRDHAILVDLPQAHAPCLSRMLFAPPNDTGVHAPLEGAC